MHGRGLYECAGCGYKASVTAGTLLHKTRTDLRKWLLAIWLLRRKITHAMRRGEHELLLRGVVELIWREICQVAAVDPPAFAESWVGVNRLGTPR